jgi:hypothetical protein
MSQSLQRSEDDPFNMWCRILSHAVQARTTSASAPCSSSVATIAVCPCELAMIRGVAPSACKKHK